MEKTKLLILRLTNRCNLTCRYCYAMAEAGKRDMSLETAIKSIGLFAKGGNKLKVQFTGGEPLLRTDLMQAIFKYVKREGIQARFSVQTNGTLLNRDNCQLLREMHCAVGVSIDGIGEANRLRNYPDDSESFNDIVSGIKTLASYGLKCNLNAVVTSVSQGRLYQLVELAAYLGNVGGIGLDIFRPLGRGSLCSYAPDERKLSEDLMAMLKRCEELNKLGVNVRIKELEKTRFMLRSEVRESCYCYAQTGLSAAVDPSGDIYPCSSLVGMPEMRLGNVKTISTISDDILQTLCVSRSECDSCSELPICRGGCPAGRIAYGGINRCDCIMHRTFIEYGRNENV